MDSLALLVKAALSGATVNIIITRGRIFRRLRGWLEERSKFFGDLVHCPLCFGTWTGLLLSAVLGLRLFAVAWPLDWFLSGLALTCLIVPLTFVIYASMHRIYLDPPEDQDQDQE